MRKIICIILLLTLFPLPALGITWEEAKPKIMATRDHPEIILGAFAAGCWLLMNTKAGKAFYKANLKGDFKMMGKVAKQGRRVRIK